ncbi:MAG: alpha/beta hydrolase [Pseudomonadota bacterium]|nr:alpha/beta hydrolase [Pseudomonadota bacterium]
MPEPDFLVRPGQERIAYHRSRGISPGVVFCGGFMSDMTGTKATVLEAFCRDNGRAYVRFDYQGHGQSGGRFEDGTISRWRDDALAVIDRLTEGPQLLIGSSMGGWISLLCALARPDRIIGLVLLAPAPDFTAEMLHQEFSPAQRRELLEHGRLERPTEYGDAPYVITRTLIEDGNRNLLLQGPPIELNCPVRIIQGMRDSDVHWRRALRLVDALAGPDTTLTLVKTGDHRLSEPEDIERLCVTVAQLWDRA